MNIHNWITFLESAKQPIPIQTARKLAKDLQGYAQYTPAPFPQDIADFDRAMHGRAKIDEEKLQSLESNMADQGWKTHRINDDGGDFKGFYIDSGGFSFIATAEQIKQWSKEEKCL